MNTRYDRVSCRHLYPYLRIFLLEWGRGKNIRTDDRKTPALHNPDAVERVPLSKRRNLLIQLLNIAGLGVSTDTVWLDPFTDDQIIKNK